MRIRMNAKPVKEFNGRSVDEVLPHIVHLSQATCREIIQEVSPSLPKDLISSRDVLKVLNMPYYKLTQILLPGKEGDYVRKHITRIGNTNLFTPRSIVLMAAMHRGFSEECREISVLAYRRCTWKDAPVKPAQKAVSGQGLISKSEPLPVDANVHGVPVSANVLDSEPAKGSSGHEVSVHIQQGTMLRVMAW